jgi:uncharacterized membrane protein YhaH (DUF805 family)
MFAVMVPSMMSTFEKMQRFAIEHPDQSTVNQGPGSYSISIEGSHPELMPDFGALFGGMAMVITAMVVLLAAAVARRLHDSGRSGVWGLMPLPFLAFGFIAMPAIFNSQEPEMNLFFGLFFNNFIYLVTLTVLVVFLASAGKDSENRFGPVAID